MKRGKMGRGAEAFERRYPSARARAAADAVIDALPMSTTLGEAADAWHAAYVAEIGVDPYRSPAR